MLTRAVCCVFTVHRTLSCPAGGIVELQFEHFATESNFDFLYLYDGDSTTSTQLGDPGGYHGFSVPAPVESSVDTMMLVFDTDGSVTAPGFSGRFQCLLDACAAPVKLHVQARAAAYEAQCRHVLCRSCSRLLFYVPYMQRSAVQGLQRL